MSEQVDVEPSGKVNVIPDEGKWWFSTWKIDHYCLTPFELSISTYSIIFFIRTGHRVYKWEYSRVQRKGVT